MHSPPWISVVRLWDDSAHTARRQRKGVHLRLVRTPIRVHLTKLEGKVWRDLISQEYQPFGAPGKRNLVALDLFRQCRSSLKKPLLLVGAPYFPAEEFLLGVRACNSAVAASVPPRLVSELMNVQDWAFLTSSKWRKCEVSFGALLMPITLAGLDGWLYAFDSEVIHLPRRGTKFIAYFGPTVGLCDLAPLLFSSPRPIQVSSTSGRRTLALRKSTIAIPMQRPNMALATRQDARLSLCKPEAEVYRCRNVPSIRFADMFAGAGGLSLGFLTARNAVYELCAALDVSEICITTLKRNFALLRGQRGITGRVASDAVRLTDLSKRESLGSIIPHIESKQAVDVLVGGPPCQPFSSARRRPAGPEEARLLQCFGDAIQNTRPSVFLLENVQGILWNDGSGYSAAQRFIERLRTSGYRVSARVLDAAWFGAAQHRSRAFIVGLHPRFTKNIDPEDAFPAPQYTGARAQPYKTVAEAIGDLPEIPNGHSLLEMPACKKHCSGGRCADQVVLDHITSRHSEYVLARFSKIKPGENWTAIREMMSNYAQQNRTHSNIYRRLEWDKPSVALGHYRKSMLIHPNQHRGLSLREAMRIQSFPDWYRLWGHAESLTVGLDRKQQQLANAVPPILARAVAERIAKLIEDEVNDDWRQTSRERSRRYEIAI